MNKTTRALTVEQYQEIIETMKEGREGFFRPNIRVATALQLEANLGIRVSDIVKLKLADIVKDGNRYRLDIVEQKTSKKRTFTVKPDLYLFIENYCLKNNIKDTEPIFDITERAVQKQLKLVCDFLELDGISTHSFRKFYATEIYNNNNHNIAIVQHLLQHSSPTVTQKYIGIEQEQIEQALDKHNYLI